MRTDCPKCGVPDCGRKPVPSAYDLVDDLNAQLDQAHLALARAVLDAQAYDDLAKHADEVEAKLARLQRWYSTPPHERERQLMAEVDQLQQRIEVTDKVACGYLDERDEARRQRDRANESADYWHSRFFAAAREAEALRVRLARIGNPP